MEAYHLKNYRLVDGNSDGRFRIHDAEDSILDEFGNEISISRFSKEFPEFPEELVFLKNGQNLGSTQNVAQAFAGPGWVQTPANTSLKSPRAGMGWVGALVTVGTIGLSYIFATDEDSSIFVEVNLDNPDEVLREDDDTFVIYNSEAEGAEDVSEPEKVDEKEYASDREIDEFVEEHGLDEEFRDGLREAVELIEFGLESRGIYKVFLLSIRALSIGKFEAALSLLLFVTENEFNEFEVESEPTHDDILDYFADYVFKLEYDLLLSLIYYRSGDVANARVMDQELLRHYDEDILYELLEKESVPIDLVHDTATQLIKGSEGVKPVLPLFITFDQSRRVPHVGDPMDSDLDQDIKLRKKRGVSPRALADLLKKRADRLVNSNPKVALELYEEALPILEHLSLPQRQEVVSKIAELEAKLAQE